MKIQIRVYYYSFCCVDKTRHDANSIQSLYEIHGYETSSGRSNTSNKKENIKMQL